jgi:hypothetical protein
MSPLVRLRKFEAFLLLLWPENRTPKRLAERCRDATPFFMLFFEIGELINRCVVGVHATIFDFVLGLTANPNDVAQRRLRHPVLVIVVKEASNTKVKQIANHLTPYAVWLDRLKGGKMNLADILLISVPRISTLEANELLGSQGFRARALSAKGNSN